MAAKDILLKQEVYFIADTEQVIGKPRVTLRRWWKEKKFPEPKMLNGRLCWKADDIHAWINGAFGASNG